MLLMAFYTAPKNPPLHLFFIFTIPQLFKKPQHSYRTTPNFNPNPKTISLPQNNPNPKFTHLKCEIKPLAFPNSISQIKSYPKISLF